MLKQHDDWKGAVYRRWSWLKITWN